MSESGPGYNKLVDSGVLGRDSRDYAFYYLRARQRARDEQAGAEPADLGRPELIKKGEDKLEELRAKLGPTTKIIEAWIDQVMQGEQAPAPFLPDSIDKAETVIHPAEPGGIVLKSDESGASLEFKEISRNSLMVDLLRRLKISYVVKGNTADQLVEAGQFRRESFYAYIMPERKKIVEVCDRVGASTTIIHDVEDAERNWESYTRLAEPALKDKYAGRVETVRWPGDGPIWQMLIEKRLNALEPGQQQHYSFRALSDRLKVDRPRLREYIEEFLQSAPEFADEKISYTTVGKKGKELEFKQYSGVFLEALESFLKKKFEVSEGSADFNSITRELFHDFGGVAVVGGSEEAAHQELWEVVRSEYYKSLKKDETTDDVKRVKHVVHISTDLKNKIKEQVIAKKKDVFESPLRPPDFDCMDLPAVVKIVADSNGIPDQIDIVGPYVHKYFKDVLMPTLYNYDAQTKKGDYGKFRSTFFGEPRFFVSPQVAEIIDSVLTARVNENKKLPPITKEDKRLNQIIREFFKIEDKKEISKILSRLTTFLESSKPEALALKPNGDDVVRSVDNICATGTGVFYRPSAQKRLEKVLINIKEKIDQEKSGG